MSLSDPEKVELFRCIRDNTSVLSRVEQRLKSGDEKFLNIEDRLKKCEGTTSRIKFLTKTIIIISPFILAAMGVYIQYQKYKGAKSRVEIGKVVDNNKSNK